MLKSLSVSSLLILCAQIVLATPEVDLSADTELRDKSTDSDIESQPVITPPPSAPTYASSRDRRLHSHATLSYALYVPGIITHKQGPTAGYIVDQDWTVEGEYLFGSYDLKFSSVKFARFREDLKIIRARYFPGSNSFSLLFGAGLRHYSVQLGDDLANGISSSGSEATPDLFESMEIENFVVQLGLGNRWQLDPGFTWGFDWFDLYLPIARTKYHAGPLGRISSSTGRDQAERAVSYLARLPTFSLLKLNLGWTF